MNTSWKFIAIIWTREQAPNFAYEIGLLWASSSYLDVHKFLIDFIRTVFLFCRIRRKHKYLSIVHVFARVFKLNELGGLCCPTPLGHRSEIRNVCFPILHTHARTRKIQTRFSNLTLLGLCFFFFDFPIGK